MYFHNRFAALVDDLEGEQVLVGLDGFISELATDKTLDVENSVLRVQGGLVFGCISDQALSISEGHVGGGDAVTLVVGNNLHTTILVDTNTRVGGAKIDTNYFTK